MTKKIAPHLNYMIHLVSCTAGRGDIVMRHTADGQSYLECRCCHRQAFMPMNGTDWVWEFCHDDCDEHPLDPHIFDVWRAKVATLEAELAKARQLQSDDTAKWYQHYADRGLVIDRLTNEKISAEKLAIQATQAQACLVKENKQLLDDIEQRDAEINRLAHAKDEVTARVANLREENEQIKAGMAGVREANAMLNKANDKLYREWCVAHKANDELVRAHTAKNELVSEVLEVRKLLAQAHIQFLEEHKQNKVLLDANKRFAEKNAELREANDRLVRWRQDFLDAEKKRWDPQTDFDV
jgi:hypothetical protein